MLGPPPRGAPQALVGSVFGVGLRLEADTDDTTAMLNECLPPQWRSGEVETTLTLSLLTATEGRYEIHRDGVLAAVGSRDDVLEVLDWMVRGHVASTAPEHIFIHAGTVAHRGRAIVIPGESFSGKTTLVTELVRAGATYYSDEYAVIDRDGRAHPYPKPLSIRMRGVDAIRVNHRIEEIGGVAGADAIPIGVVVATQYSTRADWQPVSLSPAEVVLELMRHAYSTFERPERTLETLGRAATGAVGLKGDRGEAAAVVSVLLEILER